MLCNKSYGFYAKITKNGIQNALNNQAEGEGDEIERMIFPNQIHTKGGRWEDLEGTGMLNPNDLDRDSRRGKNYFKEEWRDKYWDIDRKRRYNSDREDRSRRDRGRYESDNQRRRDRKSK